MAAVDRKNGQSHPQDVSPAAEISIDFAPVIDAQSIIRGKGILITNTKNNQEVDGNWKVSHGGTEFTFLPARALNKNEHYNIIITTKVKDKAGTHLDKKKIVQFNVASAL